MRSPGRSWAVGVMMGVVGLAAVCPPLFAREAKLSIRIPREPAPSGPSSLLPAPSAADPDAVALYEKALKALPNQADRDQIRQWLDMPIEQLPLQQVEDALQKYMESLKYAARAAKCQECRWPEWKPGMASPDPQGYRQLVQAIALWARLETAQQGYEGSLLALQTGFGVVRHLGQAPTIIQTLTGAAAGDLMCREVEQFIQAENAPNLYQALARMPKPFIEIEKAMENERKVRQTQGDAQLQQQWESALKPAQDKARLPARSVDTNLAALQIVEAIRAYAAAHAGKLPPSLSDLKEMSVPQDPASGAPFRYTISGLTAVLESAVPPGGEKKHACRYEIAVKK